MPITTSMASDMTITKPRKIPSRSRDGRGSYGTLRAVSSACCLRRIRWSTTKATIAGSSSTRPTTAPMRKFCWPMTCL